jgi:hypothetical protein
MAQERLSIEELPLTYLLLNPRNMVTKFEAVIRQVVKCSIGGKYE